EISREEPFAKKFAEVLAGLHPDMRLGFEENDLTVAEYHKIMHVHKNVMPVPTQGRVEELRMIKRKDEVKNIRRAAKIADECFECILKKIKPGVSENKIAWEIESFIRSRGVSLAFSPIVAFGRNTSQPHYNTNNKRRPFDSAQGEQNITLQKQDVVLLDFGAKVNGYCSDMTRVVFVGKPKDEWKRAYETVVNAQKKSLEYLQRSHPAWQGETFQERSSAKADRIAREVIAKAGFPAYPHSLGHGVGLDIHEAPRLTIKKDASLKPGMVVTVEPAIYKEGSYGIRIEDLVLLKKDGIELLSKSKKEMTIL
ncbi:M24 family metallopeptidase, partial [Candidatus Gottesmanbacteria bacterium]|nr:M24 family metallopeptidase [Candidatus Gottesmanbacteria bacterium]